MPESAVATAAVAHVRERARVITSRHWFFGLVLAAACLLRAAAMVGYQPVQWFNDSYSYVVTAVTKVPDTTRPGGYALMLAIFEPLHRFAPVVLVQHLLGLATGVLVYAVLRVRGVRPWIATIAAVPVLFDAYEIQLEHLVMADTLFMFLVTAAVALLCLRNTPGWIMAGAAGLLLGASVIVRTDGRPLLVVAALCLILRRAGWRPVAALVVAGLLPIVGYMGWYEAARGKFALTEGDGSFLYSRVMAFASCAKMHPPADLRPLCDSRPPSQRGPSADYVWRDNPLSSYTNNDPWSAKGSSLATKFALLAIRKQPADYLWVSLKDVGLTFTWSRSTTFPDPDTASHYQFASADYSLPGWAPVSTVQKYQGGDLTTRVHRPYASMLINYQRYIYFRGPLLAVTLLIGAAFVVTGRRRGAPGLVPWGIAVTLIVVPPATAGFSYRYVLAAIPCACMAAGLATLPGRIGETKAAAATETVPAALGQSESELGPAREGAAQPATRNGRTEPATRNTHTEPATRNTQNSQTLDSTT